MTKVSFFVALTVALGFSQGCTPTHALITPATATSQGDGVTRVAAVTSPYQQCLQDYGLSGAMGGPVQKQEFDEQGNPVVILQTNGLAIDSAWVKQECQTRVQLETKPQRQTCAQWGGRGTPSWCWRLVLSLN